MSPMKLTDRILALLETGPPLCLGGCELRITRSGEERRFSILADFSQFGEPLWNDSASRDEVLEYLAWVALCDPGRAQALETWLRSRLSSEDLGLDQGVSLVEVLRREDPALVGRVERFPALLEPAAQLVVELLERGDRFGCGNRESYENLYLQGSCFCWEAGDPLASGPDQTLRLDSQAACVQFLKRDGWLTFEGGLLRGRGDLPWKLRHFVHQEARCASLRLYLERRASSGLSRANITANTNRGW